MREIRSRYNEAQLLWQNEFWDASLILLLVGIAGASRLRYPKKDKNHARYKKQDTDAFQSYLRDQFTYLKIPTIGFGMFSNGSVGGESGSLIDIVYRHLRCDLIHEARLSERVKVNPVDGFIELKDETLFLGKDVLNYLFKSLVYDNSMYEVFADVRRPIGADFVFKNNSEEFRIELAEQLFTSYGRIETLVDVIAVLGLDRVKVMECDELLGVWAREILPNMQQFGINEGGLTGLSTSLSKHMMDGRPMALDRHTRELTTHGAHSIKEVAKLIKWQLRDQAL